MTLIIFFQNSAFVIYPALLIFVRARFELIVLLRLRETHNALQLPLFIIFLFSANLIRNIGEFGAKNYFTDHRTTNAIHGFSDSFQVFKIHGFY